MSKRFYVLYSLAEGFHPKIYKTVVTIRKHQKEDSRLHCKDFSTEEEAHAFIRNYMQGSRAGKLGDSSPAEASISKEAAPVTISTEKLQKPQPDKEQMLTVQQPIKRTETKEKAEISTLSKETKLEPDIPMVNLAAPVQQKAKQPSVQKSQIKTETKTIQEAKVEPISTARPLTAPVPPEPARIYLHVNNPRLERSSIPHFLLDYPKSEFTQPFNPNLMSDLKSASHMRQNPGLCTIQYSILQSQVPLAFREYSVGQKYKIEGQLLSLIYGMWDAYLNHLNKLTLTADCPSLYRILHQRKQRPLDPKIRSLGQLLLELQAGFDEVHYSLDEPLNKSTAK